MRYYPQAVGCKLTADSFLVLSHLTRTLPAKLNIIVIFCFFLPFGRFVIRFRGAARAQDNHENQDYTNVLFHNILTRYIGTLNIPPKLCVFIDNLTFAGRMVFPDAEMTDIKIL